jgi:hypothetical protein
MSEVPEMVDHPSHYNEGPRHTCGELIECIDVVEIMSFNVGNAVKYLWRQGKKGDALEDLKKARWYIDRAIQAAERAGQS